MHVQREHKPEGNTIPKYKTRLTRTRCLATARFVDISSSPDFEFACALREGSDKAVKYCLSLSFLSFFLYILPDPLSSIMGRCTLYTPGCRMKAFK